MNEQDTVRDLLGLAVDSVEPPAARSGESVFARAAALRRRRRVAVTGAVAVVVAGGVALGTGVLPGGTGGQNVTAVGVGGSGAHAGAAGFAKLLPAGVGTVRKVAQGYVGLEGRLVRGERGAGPYDGAYSVTRDTGVGYLTVVVRKPAGTARVACPTPAPKGVADCVTEKVPGGGQLKTWRSPDKTMPKFSYALTAQLTLKDGTVLTVTSWVDAQGGAPYRTMFTYPLTQPQLRQLALNPALLP
ncbi:hypothetical protein C6376_02960 [Streptomyces sp. P3]|uniref:hypothetical protein n=1 Tax=Streptomyces sp. P3 TaxID=2135430 RepID=UPI000D19FD10|nr:hypothetical protein [Streptomyces sp. P3]AVV40534.1 hypothetical protein C6376_02960 [Streptomyces sp. P3]